MTFLKTIIDYPPPYPESAFMAQVKELAGYTNWLTYHTHDSRRSDAGFPDLVLVRGGRVLFRELKTDRGKVTHEQEAWLTALAEAGVDADVWRPRDWEQIVETLR